MSRLVSLALLLTVLGATPSASHAQEVPAPEYVDPNLSAQCALALNRQTRSPFCPGRTLDDCPSPRAEEWRLDIRAWTDEGVSSAEIQERLQARVPGFELWPSESLGTWLLPLALLLGALPVFYIARRARGRGEDEAPTTEPEKDELDEQLEDELARLDA